jgi:hypothetical protein
MRCVPLGLGKEFNSNAWRVEPHHQLADLSLEFGSHAGSAR